MALTTTLLSSTSNRLKYSVVSDAGGGATATSTIANATLLTDCAPGPLRNLMAGVYASQAAARAVFGNGLVELHAQARALGGTIGGAPSTSANAAANAVTIEVLVADNVASETILTIEHKHSSVR